ncbi:CocE/NonD family hydrolase [Sphingomonas sp. MMS24-J45]|uniref:CocE/NonD family hydrolase n=1 Tax=Sphingomonas sp. MMS24-J45 TaxID=3238806 RepID=UPI0038507468
MSGSRREFLGATLGGLALSGTAARAATSKAPWTLPPKTGVKHLEIVRIKMRDGVELCGQIWLPADADTRPAPVVLEYIPYRTRDAYSAPDGYWGNTLASHGIGFARIDLRGSGDSGGLLRDEYLAQEQDDAVEIIAWLAAQPWSNGSVGMRGISWGGFSTLQTAMQRPPALKAIMPMACSDRRFTDDAHFVGGCLGLTNFKWGANFKGVMAAPPDPAVAGPGWEKLWRDRLEASPAIIARWTRHQREDAYWRHGSLHFDYAAITCPTYIVGGWADAYVHSVPRLLEELKCPRKALVGPWGHTYAWLGGPGPALDWAYEEVRWWSHWLRGAATGIMDEPMLRFYRPEATPAQSAPGATPGAWGAEAVWPSPDVHAQRLYLTDAGLAPRPGAGKRRQHRSDNAVGLATPEWVPFGQDEMPGDQRHDDAASICYDMAPLPADVELLGVPRVRLRVAADKPVAQIAVRLCKVMHDGTSWRLAYGILNLTHRDGHATPKPLIPGKMVDVTIDLGFLAQRLKTGERLRIAISEGLWPLVWPSPDSPTLTLDPNASALTLPIRTPPLIEPAMPIQSVPVAPDRGDVAVKTVEDHGGITVTGTWPDKSRPCANGTILSGFGPNTVATITRGAPNSGSWSGSRISRYRRGDWNCELRIGFTLTSTARAFTVGETLTAFKDGVEIFRRDVTNTVPRDLL